MTPRRMREIAALLLQEGIVLVQTAEYGRKHGQTPELVDHIMNKAKALRTAAKELQDFSIATEQRLGEEPNREHADA